MRWIGAHVSTQGGVANAPRNARDIGATTFALFTKNQRQWNAAPLTDESIEGFRRNCAEAGFSLEKILPHDSYLINLGSPDREGRAKSLEAFVDELERCRRLGLAMLNFHPGSHLGEVSEDESLKLVADALNTALARVPGVVAVIENTAGQGTNLGYRFEHIARLVELTDDKSRVGVCLDTCHALAAGYDLATEQGYAETFRTFDATVGLAYLRAFHVNDSKKGCGCRTDRHESLGKGALGNAFFERLVRDARFRDLPLILETPDEALWPAEIAWLKSLA